MSVAIVNLQGYEDGLDDLGAMTTLPVLQDTSEAGVADAYGGASNYTYFVDAAGYPRIVHYSLEFSTDEERFLSDLASTREAAR